MSMSIDGGAVSSRPCQLKWTAHRVHSPVCLIMASCKMKCRSEQAEA